MAKTMNRVWIVTIALIGAVAGFALFMHLITALEWHNRPFVGMLLTPNLAVDGYTPLGTEQWPGLANGLQPLDQIITINETALHDTASAADYATARARYQATMETLQPGDTVSIEFNRPVGGAECPVGAVADCAVSYQIGPFPVADWVGFFMIPFVSGIVTFLIGAVLLALRSNQPAARLISLIAFSLSIVLGGLFDLNASHQLVPLWLIASASLAGAIATFSLLFPIKSTWLFTRPRLLYLPWVISIAAAAFFLWLYDQPPTPTFEISSPSFILIASSFVLLITALWHHRRFATSAVVRDQSNTILIGVILTGVPVVIWMANIISQALNQANAVPVNILAATPFALTAPFSMAYAVLQYRHVDTDRVISQAITYGMMLFALASGYGLLVFSLSLVFTQDQSVLASSPVLVGITIFLMAALFLPVRTFLQRRIDKVYFRQRYDFQEYVEQFTSDIAQRRTLNDIVTRFCDILDQTVAPTNLFVFMSDRQTGNYVALDDKTDIHFEADTGIVTALAEQDQIIYLEPRREWPVDVRAERSRLQILNVLVIIGLRGSDQMNGFICICPPQSGIGHYNHEELMFVQSLVSQMSIAVERAQVVETLEGRVRELDVLGQVGQAVNYAINLDDLLELLSAQTNRLIEAPYFYIALSNDIGDQLQFAFYLEDDERYPERENRPWPLGNDLFSEVVRHSQPMRLNDYAAAAAERNMSMMSDEANIRAWMGVPLIAGANTLGVMAVGMSSSNSSYSNDQFKIFSDISSLAATSIEKANLFSQTNERARQLAALNDISSQLAREQQHVDKLLDLITNSAVDILNAEAGSLLLSSEDDSDELEFKIAVGAAGADLVGKRFPADEGLAGEVVQTGQPVIVNDTSRDPRWAGEVSQTGFHTSSILAVPLIANNQTVGVLELLNKKDRGTFSEDDANLLSTFAGQAAIAIDNARLFEMTDLQLSERVQELETLERIDAELNRSLDVQAVAEITIRWAVSQVGATAAALGIKTGEPPFLDIAARYGYNDDDLPEGATSKMWPLDKGIISRVMRTRQADLAPDISIDPDYIAGQRHALSQITVPMMSGDDINALLILEKNTEPRLNLVDLAFVQRLAEHASIALVNAQLYVDLARANDSKSEFVSFVAHELKTPMTSIKGYTDLLLGGITGEVSEQQETFLGTIKSNIERMNTLVSDLNDATKLQTGNLHMEFKPVDFHNVIDEMLRPLQHSVDEKAQQLDIQMPDDLSLIHADQNRLIQVMTNLLSNACKYTPEQGDIQIVCEVTENRWNGGDTSRVLHVCVKDTGIGMSDEDLAKLFTPYFRSDNPQALQQPGTGLGLTITQGIIERHNGQVWVVSELGEGTEFHFTVPLAAEGEIQPSEQS